MALRFRRIDPTLVTSKALTLGEGIIASGGNRAMKPINSPSGNSKPVPA